MAPRAAKSGFDGFVNAKIAEKSPPSWTVIGRAAEFLFQVRNASRGASQIMDCHVL